MRISELSTRSGVSTASIKFYAREGLLPAGERTGYNQTDYSEAHLRRLRLIRSLIDVGGLPVAAAARVLASIDAPDHPLEQVLSTAQSALPQPVSPPSPASVRRAEEFVAGRGWRAGPQNPGLRILAGVLDAWAAVGREDLASVLPEYARAADVIAEADLDAVSTAVEGARTGGDRAAAAQTVVVGTVLGDQLLVGLRRIAQENASARRYRPTEGNPS
ncbi:MerR family transcriptional regulator [Kineococcus gynurae]|uniref:MerR family transcriptional regulator n=1 Tax=Kineococcus gynurae TaxID=452979 RepID=A0ABV5LSW0_9ACTN